MLHKKDLFMNWYEPQQSMRGSRMPEVIRVYSKAAGNHTITVSTLLAERLGLKDAVIRVSFSFDDEQPFVTFNPIDGVPFLKLKKQEGGYKIGNKHLAYSFVKRFGLGNTQKYYDFEVIKWEVMNGMQLYKIYQAAK